MQCPHCGEENPAGFRVCGFCARPLASTAARPETRKLVTLVFADVSGSTALGEQFDAEVVRRVMLEFFEIAREVLELHGGMVEKFVGDAVMAAFGIPRVHEDDALRAVRAAADLRDRLREFGREVEQRYGTPFGVRIGVNTGEVVAGETASAQAFASGDAVNLTARLEQAAPPGEVLLGESTVRLLRGAVAVVAVEPLALKGKSQPVPAWRLIDVRAGEMGATRRQDAPLIGRDDELAVLLAAWDRALRDRAVQLVTVVAPAGTGKTRLTMELAEWLRGDAQVLTGSCLPYGDGITFRPIAEIVRQAAAVDAEGPHDVARSKLARLMQHEEGAALICAQLEPVLGLSSRVVSIEETFWSVRTFLETLASRSPLLVVLDDLHWAEEALLDLIDYLASRAGGVPLLLVCGTRPDLLERRAPLGGRGANAATLVLEPLGSSVSGELMRFQLGGGDLPRDLATRILETAAGNPLFIQELVRMLVDEGVVVRRDGAWRTTTDVHELAMPATIQALLAARLDQLDDGERDIAQRAAVVGEVFSRTAVRELCDEPARLALADALGSLARKQFITPEVSTLTAGDAFRFRHVLVRDAAYAGLVKSMRAELHERCARWLEDARSGSALEHDEVLGYHFEQAAVYRRELGDILDAERVAAPASARLAAAGRRALASGDVPAAANLLSRAADVLPPEHPQRAGIRLEAIPALVEAGRIDRADAGIDDILARGGENLDAGGGRAQLAANAWRAFVDSALSRETLLSGVPAIEAWMTACRDDDDPAGLAVALDMLARTRADTGRIAEADELWWSAAEQAARAGDHRAEAEALSWLLVSAVDGPLPVSLALERCRAIGNRAGASRKVQAFVAIQRGVLEAMQGHVARGRESVAQARQELAELGQSLYAVGTAREAAAVEAMAPDPEAAEAILRPALGRYEEMGEQAYYSTHAGVLAHLLCDQGRFGEAAAFVTRCRETAPADDLMSQELWRSALARIAAREGDDATALELAEAALALLAETDWLVDRAGRFVDLAEVHALAGRAAEAGAALDQADDLYRRKGSVAGLDLTRARRVALGL